MAAKPILFLIVFNVEYLVCNEIKELECKPKAGCHIARCDPSPPGILSFLQRNEYPITCVHSTSDGKDEFVTTENYKELFALFTKNLVEMAKFKEGEIVFFLLLHLDFSSP